MLPADVVEYLRQFGFLGIGVLFYWALTSGRLFLKREVDFIIAQKDSTIIDLRSQLVRAQNEVDSQRGLMNKVVDHALERGKESS